MSKNTELLQYIYNQRWCNFKEEITDKKVVDIKLYSTEFDTNKLFVIGEADIKNKPKQYFIMPLIIGKSKEYTSFKYKNNYAYDALVSSDYWKGLMRNISLDKTLVINQEYNLIYQSWDGFDYITKHIEDESKPLGAEQSNTTLIIGNKDIAFKQQRIIEFSNDVNSEIDMNYQLMKNACSVVPKTYGYLSLVKSNGETAFVGIVQEFVKNKGDLWEISRDELVNILQKAFQKNVSVIPFEKYEHLVLLMKKLGQKTSLLIQCFKTFSEKNSVVKDITFTYLRSYKKQLKELIEKTKQNILNNINNLTSDMALNIQEPLKNFRKYIDIFIKDNFSKIEMRDNKGLLMRVHGDFHLGQAIQTLDNDIKIIDFSGEPHLSFSQRKERCSYMYDIAGMYRSITGYLPIVVSKKFATDENGNIDNEKLVWANEILKPITKYLSDAFLSELEIDREWFNIEVFRRNLYEINYEIAYRPTMLFIPINNLKELILQGK